MHEYITKKTTWCGFFFTQGNLDLAKITPTIGV